MNDTAIKNYAMWARRELIADVQKRCMRYGILEEGSLPANADTVDGRVLTSVERTQRAELLRIAREDGYRELVERAAYTWFNRLLAIRFMEVNDRLPSHVRVLSAPDGSFKPQAIGEAMDLPLEALDPSQVAELVQAGNDEDLFRAVFLAQCDELADCMPAVFDKVGSAMELLLPDGLLREGGVAEQLVSAIPERDWTEGVEIVGWMYQYYVSERKDEVFASFKKGKKAERDAIAPATQLFTPNWIVRYLTENSLGRLWMLNRPDSSLPEDMPYFVKPDEDHETEFKHVDSPEDITVVDPACGSGHILVYAFELLAKMYAEDGYTGRDAARLILEKNLSGMEIDPRAGAMASFALTMKACELDSRFLRRGVSPRITVLSRVEFDGEEQRYIENLRNRPELMDAAAHLDECGSLLTVTKDDLEAVARDLASLAGEGSIFGGSAAAKLERLQAELRPLSCRYDVVVANPPYMGAKNMNSWLSSWVKKHYADVKGDLFSCFMVRNSGMGTDHAQMGFMTPYVWMFIGTYEKLRKYVIEKNTITSLIQLEYSGFAGATVPICTFTLQMGKIEGYKGGYIRLSGFPRADQQAPRALEALADPGCGWFYRADADGFGAIPGSPIAYWANRSVANAFETYSTLAEVVPPKSGLTTGNNDTFLRLWWECSSDNCCFDAHSRKEARSRNVKWFPCNKGGEFRKWFGNRQFVVNWKDDGGEMRSAGLSATTFRNSSFYFREGLTWSSISSSSFHMRWSPAGSIGERKGAMAFSSDKKMALFALGAMNSSPVGMVLKIVAPTLDYSEGPISRIPIPTTTNHKDEVVKKVENNILLAADDWDAFETSWDFKHHPLV
ncbi:BREX-1 system adenine-specific DNA-methyltransferase PglX [Senegalimassilia anaerobia]|uniref:BREX-1 system adenine-specific DNA-methyltransferase PglX n=1 Tax=Senegalimassilia anaerobia TaxID=1473216 RepID=UPI003A986CE2